MIDFIGQQGPTSKWKLGGLDMCILLLQLIMVSVHVKRRELKKKLARTSASGHVPANNNASTDTAAAGAQQTVPPDNAARNQDADSEERGLLRRTDTMSEIGADAEEEEEDGLLTSASGTGHVDALDMLTSGQCIIGEFILMDTLLEENRNYNAYRRTRMEGTSDMPETLRRLNTLRQRFGVGGG